MTTPPLTLAGGTPFIPGVNQSADLAIELSLDSSEVKKAVTEILKDHNILHCTRVRAIPQHNIKLPSKVMHKLYIDFYVNFMQDF